MPDTRRLVSKIDEAITALKPQRRKGITDGSRLAEQLRERFAAGRSFEVLIGGRPYPINCDKVRVSRTSIDLGVGADGVFSFIRVSTCEHETDDAGDPVYGFGLIEDDDSVTPFAFS